VLVTSKIFDLLLPSSSGQNLFCFPVAIRVIIKFGTQFYCLLKICNYIDEWGRRGRDCIVAKFTTTCAISAYHH
jgi:hypothetical protein